MKKIKPGNNNLKYFEAGHTYMSADFFHHLVEKETEKMSNFYDFQDFMNFIANLGRAVSTIPKDSPFRKVFTNAKNNTPKGRIPNQLFVREISCSQILKSFNRGILKKFSYTRRFQTSRFS